MATITDLTGYTWVGNNPISSYQNLTANFNIEENDLFMFNKLAPSYESQYIGFFVDFFYNSLFSITIGDNSENIYLDEYNENTEEWVGDSEWGENNSRTLIFLGGSGVTNTDVIKWLEDNGTFKLYEPMHREIGIGTYEFFSTPKIFSSLTIDLNFTSINQDFIGIRFTNESIFYITENNELEVFDNTYNWGKINDYYAFVTVKNTQNVDGTKYLWLFSNWNISQTDYYTLLFNSNGATSGEPPSSQTLKEGTVFNLVDYNPNNLAKTNSTFLGWNTTADVTEVINEIIVTSDTTLYAIFKETKSDVFELKLYQSTAEPNRVNKTSYLTLVNTLQGALRNYTSITDLSVTIEYESVPNFNYIYIPIFNRYYFITDISSVREHLWEISASCDVLMTYKDGLLNCSAFIDRNENSYDQLIIDDKLPIKQGQTVDVHFITNTLFDINSGKYVLQGLNLSIEEDTGTDAQNIDEVVKEVEVNGD